MAGWRDRVELTVELGLRGAAGGSFQWDVSNWDAGAGWSGIEPTWAALSPTEVRSARITRGRRAGARERYRTGTATVVMWWEEPAGHWSFKPAAPVQLGQELRLSAKVDGGAPIPLYRGSVNGYQDDWDPDGPYELTVNLVDRKADLAAVDLPEAASAVGLGDTTDARLERIITELAGISDYYLRLGTSAVEHQSSLFPRNLLDEAEVTAEGEGGAFYVDREGFYVFRPRGWFLDDERAIEVQLTWTNVLGDPLGVNPRAPFGTYESLQDLVNQVSMARAGGTAYTAGPDSSSVLTYGLRTHQRFDLTLRYDADVVTTADELLAQLKDRTQGLRSLQAELHPREAAAWIEALLDLELGDLHELIWDDGSGDLFAEGYHLQGVAHNISADSWTVAADLWHYVGVTLPAKWGSAVWGSSKWGA